MVGIVGIPRDDGINPKTKWKQSVYQMWLDVFQYCKYPKINTIDSTVFSSARNGNKQKDAWHAYKV